MQPTITTIIPTYRRPEQLKRAILSVTCQTYPHFQVCVYDNASGDSTRQVVEELAKEDPRIQYFCHAKDIGAAENFQFGLSRIHTPFFSFLSDDDLLLPNFYETALEGLTKYPEAAFFSGAVIDKNDKNEIVDIIHLRWPDLEHFTSPEGLIEMIGKYSNWIGVLFRREIIQKIGGIDTHLKAIDVDYMFRAAAACSFAFSKKPCAIFVQHPSSYSSSHGLKLIWPGWQIMMNKVQESAILSSKVKEDIQLRLQSDLRRLLIMNMLRSLEKKSFAEAKTIADIFAQNSGRTAFVRVLKITLWICKYVPFSHALFVCFLNARRRFKRNRLLPFYNDGNAIIKMDG